MSVAVSRGKSKFKKRRRFKGPVILPSAIEAYLKRALDDFTPLKKWADDDLLEQVVALDSQNQKFNFHTDPFHHQLVCFVIGISLPEFLFFLDPGAGKTKLILDVWYWLKLNHSLGRLLVLVPAAVNCEVWLDEVKRHRPELRAVQLLGDRDTRERLLQIEADVYLLNYDGLLSYMTHLEKGTGRVIDKRLADSFAQLFDGVVYDESHLVGSGSGRRGSESLRFSMCWYLSKRCARRFALTGTPFGRRPERLFPQFYLVDHGETLGSKLGMFRAVFFDAKEKYFGGMEYVFDREKEGKLHDILKHRSIRYADKEFSDMPPVVYKTHRLSFGVDAEKYYERVLNELRASRGNLREFKNSYMRMRQVCAGYLSLKGDDESKVEVQFYTNPKLEALETIIDGLDEEEKLIIYHYFVPSGNMISDLLTRKKRKFVRLGGGEKNPIKQKNLFENDARYTHGVFNVLSGATGLNPQYVCCRAVFYDQVDDPIIRTQAEKRLDRTGQTRRVYIDDLVIAKSVDERMMEFVREGKSLFDAICNGEVKL